MTMFEYACDDFAEPMISDEAAIASLILVRLYHI
jgi:hypothetical protein